MHNVFGLEKKRKKYKEKINNTINIIKINYYINLIKLLILISIMKIIL